MQMTQKVKITWKAFGDKVERGRFISSVEVETNFPETVSAKEICEIVFADTNCYQGYIWGLIEKKLSATRTHTSISVGDEIEIDGQVYICADFGFEKIEEVEIKKIEDTIFSVQRKEVA
jgi:hypothetical protein